MASIRKDCILIKLLREIVYYDPITGGLTWLPRQPSHFEDASHSKEHVCARWNTRYAGKAALTAIEQAGYLHGDMMGQRYKAHRVVWALHFGQWPSDQIDHINGNPADNRIKNLRCVTAETNMRNQKLSCANKSGVIGVCWAEHRGKWSAQIKMNGRKEHLGLFAKLSDAAAARKVAEAKYGFHPNHGRIAA